MTTQSKPDALERLHRYISRINLREAPQDDPNAIIMALETERLELRQAIIRVGGIALMEGHNFGSPLQEAIKDAMKLVSDDEDNDE